MCTAVATVTSPILGSRCHENPMCRRGKRGSGVRDPQGHLVGRACAGVGLRSAWPQTVPHSPERDCERCLSPAGRWQGAHPRSLAVLARASREKVGLGAGSGPGRLCQVALQGVWEEGRSPLSTTQDAEARLSHAIPPTPLPSSATLSGSPCPRSPRPRLLLLASRHFLFSVLRG